MWRRVSCEQPLDTSQSILRLRGSADCVEHTCKAENINVRSNDRSKQAPSVRPSEAYPTPHEKEAQQ